MSEKCYKCYKPVSACLCKFIQEIDCGIKFVFLMHTKEAKRQRTGTGSLAHISLKNSEIIVGLEFSKNARFQELLHSDKYFPVLMYPGEDAWTTQKEGFKEELNGRKLLAIIIDSTWFCSKKMIKLSTNIMALPKLSFSGEYRSIFTFKREPHPECVSTIETCYYLIREFQESGLIEKTSNPESLMDAFKMMIKFQLQKENDRIAGLLPNTHANDYKFTKKKEIPDFN